MFDVRFMKKHISFPHWNGAASRVQHPARSLPCKNSRTGWWFGTWILFSISYMGCHPNPIDFHSIIFQDGEIAPPTREKLLGTWPTFGWIPRMPDDPMERLSGCSATFDPGPGIQSWISNPPVDVNKKRWKIDHFWWVIQRFLWQFSIATC